VAKTSTEIRDEIEREREELSIHLRRLEATLKRPLNVRGFIEQHPTDALVIALGAGFFLSSLLGRSGPQRAPEAREVHETLSLTGSALVSLARRQVQQVRSGATHVTPS
jgi:hypothetical protein